MYTLKANPKSHFYFLLDLLQNSQDKNFFRDNSTYTYFRFFFCFSIFIFSYNVHKNKYIFQFL